MKLSRGNLLIGGLLVGAALFALLGGQYSAFDLMQQNATRRELRAAIDSLRAEVDSLEAYRKALISDAKLQERIAREAYGMSRAGEIVYKIVE